jgi:predicted DsbA family dithiol-disulfide isomerase
MHDLMFAHQRDLSQAKYDAWAEDLGLDMQRFHAALDSHKFKAQIERDAKEGSSIGASGTPTFFINGHKLVGAQPQEGFERVIDDELQHAAKLLRQGVPANALYDHMMKEAPAPAAEEDEEEGD